MAHEVENMMYVGQTPWHGLGFQYTEPPKTVEEAIVMAGLDWEVELRDLYLAGADVETSHGNTVTVISQRPTGARATVRATDGKVLGTVGMAYHPLQNKRAFGSFQPFMDAGEATIETAGSLAGGRRIWILAKLMRAQSEVVPGDNIVKYLLLSHAHDGSSSIHYGMTPTRVVCANTERMALKHGGSTLIKVPHTKGAAKTIDELAKLVNTAEARFEATVEEYRALARRKISKADLEKYVRVLIGVQPETADVSTWHKKRIATIVDLAENGVGTEVPGVKGTWWAAYNGYTHFLSHERGNDAARRLDSNWFGAAAKQNDAALSLALQQIAA